MIDGRAIVNMMPFEVKGLGMHVDTTYGRCYSMDNRSIPMVGIMKDVEFKIVSCLEPLRGQILLWLMSLQTMEFCCLDNGQALWTVMSN